MTQSQTPPTLGIERKSRCTRTVIPGDDTIADSTNPWHWETEQMHKTIHTRRWHNHRLPPTLGIERKSRCTRPVIPGDDTITDSTNPWHREKEQMHKTSHTRRWHNHRPPTLGIERKSRCTRLVIPGDVRITDSTYPWHREKDQLHKTSHTRRWHNHRLHLPLA